MTRFCGSCGAQLNGTEAFCGKCGARTAPADAPLQQQVVVPAQPVQPVQYVPVAPAQALPPAPPAKSSPILKIILVLVILLALGGALVLGGIFYAAHRASQKIHELARESSGVSNPFSDNTVIDDPCRFLTKDEVSQATGVTIVRVRPRSTGCAYIAEGDPQEMISKHLAMTNGTEGLAGANSAKSGPSQDVEVFSYSVLGGAVQKALVGKIFENLGPTSQGVSGVGDQAVVVGGGMMMVRKGDKTVQIVYMRCPCNTDAVKPLAQKLVSAL